MSHYVKCVYCQQRFDRDKEEYVSVGGRRYGHVECHNKDMAQIFIDEINALPKHNKPYKDTTSFEARKKIVLKGWNH